MKNQARQEQAEKLASELGEVLSNLSPSDSHRLRRMTDMTLVERIAKAESDILRHSAFERPDQAAEVSDFLAWYIGLRRILNLVRQATDFATGEVDNNFDNPDVWRQNAEFIRMIADQIGKRLEQAADTAQAG